MAKKTFKYNSQEAGNTPTDGSTSGFPSPAADYGSVGIDLNTLLVEHPSSVFFAWLTINDKESLAIIDRALHVTDGCQVVAWDNGEWYIKRFKVINNNAWLYPIKGDKKPILVNPDEPHLILGRLSKLVWMNP